MYFCPTGVSSTEDRLDPKVSSAEDTLRAKMYNVQYTLVIWKAYSDDTTTTWRTSQ